MKPLKKSISVSLDKDIVDGIKILAKKSGYTLSQYINLVLKAHYPLNDKSTAPNVTNR